MFNIDLCELKGNIFILFLNFFLVFLTHFFSSINIYILFISLVITIGILYYIEETLDKINGYEDLFVNCMKNIFMILFTNIFIFIFVTMLYYHPLITSLFLTIQLFGDYCEQRG